MVHARVNDTRVSGNIILVLILYKYTLRT